MLNKVKQEQEWTCHVSPCACTEFNWAKLTFDAYLKRGTQESYKDRQASEMQKVACSMTVLLDI